MLDSSRSLLTFSLSRVTTGAGIASYPLDTIRRRMMMTSGEKVHYNGMLDAGRKIVAAEGVSSLFKGAGERSSFCVSFVSS
jgi:hypothetical protein